MCQVFIGKSQIEAKSVKELTKWEDLMLDSIEGTCVFTPEQIKKRMDAVQTTLDGLTVTPRHSRRSVVY